MSQARVVIAEDEAIIRLDLKELLEEEGYEVVGETGRGDEAVELVRELKPDLAILDIKMPGLDGLTAARHIVGERLAAVLILTAFSQRDLVEQARDAGAIGYIVKPFQKSDLIPAIEVALGRHKELEDLARDVGDAAGPARRPQGHGPGQGDAPRPARTLRGRRLHLPPPAGDESAYEGGSGRPDGRRRLAEPVKLLLLDGHSLAYRAFYALPTDLATSSGMVTNAVYGFTAMLVKVLGDEQPDYVAVAFDTPTRTFRNDMDVDYKANRKETPDLFRSQLPLIRQVLEALQIPTVELEGVEADDVIGTLATRAAAKGIDTIVVTGDRDSYQLVQDPHLKVLYNKRGVSDYALYDEAGIKERTGVTPAQYPDYAAMRGDTSDNLPGVPGIGEKTAAKLINTYDDLEGIFEHLDDLPPKQRTNLGEMRDRVFQNREMMRLRLDCEISLDPDDLVPTAFDREEVRTLFTQLEFRTLYPRLLEAVGSSATGDDAPDSADGRRRRRPRSDGRGRGRAARRDQHDGRAVRLEPRWAGIPGRSDIVGLGVAAPDGVASYVDGDLLGDETVRDALTRLVAADGPPLVAHRAKELMHGLRPVERVVARSRHGRDGVPARSG